MMNPLLHKKVALDPWFEQINEPDYAEHQHHSDPGYTTQNGKDYAGRNTTEPEDGALQDGIPANLLSIELGKQAKVPKPAGRARRFSSDVDNPHVTTMPSAPAPVDPSDATFFKESDPMPDQLSVVEENITSIVSPEDFHYGARVTDGTTLWFRGNNERLIFDPKTGKVSYLRGGKTMMECSVRDLKSQVGMLKSVAREFHETLKKRLGQTAAIRPSPTKVFEDKVDNATGKKPVAPTEPNDDEVMKAQMTLENAGVGDPKGINAAESEESSAKEKEFPEGWHAYDTEGEEIKTSATTKTYGSGTPPGGTPNDPSIDAEDDEEDKTASIKGVLPRAAAKARKRADIGIRETPKFLPPRNDIRRHLDTEVQDEVMEGVMDEDKTADATEGEVVPRKEGNWKLYAFPPDTPLGPYGSIPRPVPKHDVWYVGDKAKALPIAQENWGPLDHAQENQLLSHGSLDLPDALLRLTSMDYSKAIVLPPRKKIQASDDAAGEYYLDKVRDMKNEAKEAFMMDGAMQQEAQDAGMGMGELWDEIGGAFTENYYISAYSKQGSIDVYEGLKCPNCKSTNGKPVEDGMDDGVSLRECLTCRGFYSV